jgi:hypothetical protein
MGGKSASSKTFLSAICFGWGVTSERGRSAVSDGWNIQFGKMFGSCGKIPVFRKSLTH